MAGRILYLVGHYPSVSETFVEHEIRGLRKLGLEIEVFPLYPFAPVCALQALMMNPSIAQKKTQRLKLWARSLSAVPAARRVKHIHGHFLGVPASVAHGLAQMLDLPYSLTGHARDIHVETTPPEVIAGACFRTVCTEAARQYLRTRYPESPFTLIRHGISPTAPAATRTGGPLRILAVGRCVEKKGFRHLVEACALLSREGCDYRCTVIGEGPLLPELRGLALRHCLNGRVRFSGALPHREVLAQFRYADVLVVPSVMATDGDRDGLPNVILEAMARGVPVIATDAGAITEAVKDEQSGLLVPQRDAQALAAAIQRIHTDLNLRDKLTKEAMSCIEDDFNPAVWLEKLRQMFLKSLP